MGAGDEVECGVEEGDGEEEEEEDGAATTAVGATAGPTARYMAVGLVGDIP